MIKKVRNKLIFSLLTAFVFFMALGALAFGGVTNVAKADEIVSEFQMLNGASVRYIAPTGIRFTSRMSADDYDTLMENHSDAEIATLLLPTHMLGENTLTVDNYESLGAAKAEFTERYVVDGYATFNAVLTGLDSSFYNTDLTAVSYIKVGESVQYAQYTENEEVKTSVSRNIANTSAAALASGKYNSNEEAYLFLTDMVFTGTTVESSMSGTAGTSQTNVGVVLDTAFTKDGSAVDSGVISNVTYTADNDGKVVENNGTQYFYAPSAGSYTVTSTATIKQGGVTTDITSNKTITVSAPSAQSIGWIYNNTDSEIKFYLKTLSDETEGTYVLNLPGLGNLMTITRTSENKGTISLLNSQSMVSGKRYAAKTSELDFGSGVYVKVIKYATADNTAVTTVYTSAKGESYSLYAAAFYSSIYDFNFNGQSLASASYNTILLTASTPVFVSNFSTTTETSETKITSLPVFEQFKVGLAASASSIRVGGSSNLTFTATYDDENVTALSTVNYTIEKGGEITEDARITDAGVFTTNVAGTYKVTATATYEGKEKTASVNITVLDNELSATLSFTPSPVEAKVSSTASLSVIYNDEEVVSGYTVVYSIISANAANARITDAGVFTADENGTYTVRAAVSYNGLNYDADRDITVAATHEVVIDLSDTTSDTRTNVGVFLYDTITVDGDVTVKYPVSWTASGDGTIATFNGQTYFYATSKGDYTITATVTVDDVDYEQTKTITVSDSTAYSAIYSCDFNADYRDDATAGTKDVNVIIGRDGYYYGARNNTVDNALFFNGGYSVSSTYAIEMYIKYIGTVSADKTLFFTMWADSTNMGDGITLVRANGANTATLTIAGVSQSGNKDFGSGLYLRILSITEGGTHKFKVYTSADRETYTLWASANATGNYALSFTGLCLFSQTPVMVANFNVIENAAIVADMGGTASSAYTDERVTLDTAVSFGGNSVGANVAYAITSGDCATIENGVLIPSAAGSVTVTATATYNGFTATASKVITFNEHTLTATVSANETSVEAGGDEITLMAAATYDGNVLDAADYEVSYSVSPNGASVENGKFSATTEGTYTVTLTVSYSEKEATDTVVIYVGSAEPVIAGTISLSAGSTTLNLGDATYLTPSVTFTIDGAASNAYTVEYSTTGGTLGNNGTGEYFYSTNASTYTITATLKYNGDTIATDTVSITVNTNNRTEYGNSSAVTDMNASGNIDGLSYNTYEMEFYIQFLSQVNSDDRTIFFTGHFNGSNTDHMKIFRKSGGNNGTIWVDTGNVSRTYYNADGTTYSAGSDGAGRTLNFANGIHIKLIRIKDGNSGTIAVFVSEDGGLTYTPYAKTSATAWGWYDSTLTGYHFWTQTHFILGKRTFSTTPTESIPS